MAALPRSPVMPCSSLLTIIFLVAGSGVSKAQWTAGETIAAPMLRAKTPVILCLKNNLHQKDASPGQDVEFEVVEDAVVNGQVVVPTGAVVHGSVRLVDRPNKGPVKVLLDLGAVQTVSGETVRLSGKGATTGEASLGLKDASGIVGMAPETLPAMPVVLPVLAVMQLFPGRKAILHKGTLIPSEVGTSIPLDAAKLQIAQAHLSEVAKLKDGFSAEALVKHDVESGDLDSAIAMVKWAMPSFPNERGLHYELGRLLLKKGDTDAAIIELQWGLGDAKYPLANCEMGGALELKGEHEAALAQYRAAFQANNLDALCRAAYDRMQGPLQQ